VIAVAAPSGTVIYCRDAAEAARVGAWAAWVLAARPWRVSHLRRQRHHEETARAAASVTRAPRV
jgi:hypothetical protein